MKNIKPIIKTRIREIEKRQTEIINLDLSFLRNINKAKIKELEWVLWLIEKENDL